MPRSRRLLFVFGTRPEAIKLAPLYLELKEKYRSFEVFSCSTGQHREMLSQVLTFFNVKVDYNLDLMVTDQSLFDITSRALIGIRDVLEDLKPQMVIVQGDTTSAMAAALASFYEKVTVSHVEAGLRSHSKFAPFPEEMNRIIISHLADFHFAPTKEAKQNLFKENVRKNVFVVGNTVIDALFFGLKLISKDSELRSSIESYFEKSGLRIARAEKDTRLILVTSHRRENFGEKLKNICEALKEIASLYPEVTIVYPVHLNPNVRNPVRQILSEVRNVILVEPLDYPHLIYLLSKAYLVLTDSGGLQEESPALGKPVLVMREVTERPEGVRLGCARVVGVQKERIVTETRRLLEDISEYEKMSHVRTPYGDGKASQRIARILDRVL